VKKDKAKPGEEVLKVKDLRVRDIRGLETVRGVSFSVRAGEVLGIAGVQGNGQTELAEALTGLRPVESGHFILDGKDLTGKPPRPITETGLAHIPEDRQRHGLVLSYTVADNMVLADYYQPRFSKGIVIQQNQVDSNARKLIKDYDVRTPSPFTVAGKLSGGNQQKVIIAKWVARPPKVFILDEPTRGIDVGARAAIYDVIADLARSGMAVVVVSSDLEEVLGLSHRVLVLSRGRQRGILDRGEASNVAVMELATS